MVTNMTLNIYDLYSSKLAEWKCFSHWFQQRPKMDSHWPGVGHIPTAITVDRVGWPYVGYMPVLGFEGLVAADRIIFI